MLEKPRGTYQTDYNFHHFVIKADITVVVCSLQGWTNGTEREGIVCTRHLPILIGTARAESLT